MKMLSPTPDRMLVRYVLPSAIRCFFHVYEERLGRYGWRVRNHVLDIPGTHDRDVLRTGCRKIVDPRDYVIVTNDIIVDRTWCRTCAAAVDAEIRRGHAPNPPEEILARARAAIRPLTKEVL